MHLGLIYSYIPTLKALVSNYKKENSRRGFKPVLLGDSVRSLGAKPAEGEVVKGAKWVKLPGLASKNNGKTEDLEMSPTSPGAGSDCSAETRDTRDTRMEKYL